MEFLLLGLNLFADKQHCCFVFYNEDFAVEGSDYFPRLMLHTNGSETVTTARVAGGRRSYWPLHGYRLLNHWNR
jgi:hypothetical protein